MIGKNRLKMFTYKKIHINSIAVKVTSLSRSAIHSGMEANIDSEMKVTQVQ